MYGWCVAIRGVEGGGLVEGLPVAHLPDRRRRRRAEVPDRDRHHRPAREGARRPRLHPARPLQEHRLRGVLRRRSRRRRRRSTTRDAANANARLSTQLPYIFAVSRFAHYLKAMMRDKIGSFMSREDVRDASSTSGSRTTSRPTTRPRRQQGAATRCARPGSRSRKFRASLAPTAPSPSCGRTSSSTSCRSRCGWWPSCRLRRRSNRARPGRRLAARRIVAGPGSAPATSAMSRIDDEIRIRPSVLDRLVDFEPDVTRREAAGLAVEDPPPGPKQVREAGPRVAPEHARDVLIVPEELPRPPSMLAFGLPDFSRSSVKSADDQHDLRRRSRPRSGGSSRASRTSS